MARAKRRSRDEWEEIVMEQEISEQSARAFCGVRKIGLASFYKWRCLLKKESSKTKGVVTKNSFVELGPVDSGVCSNRVDSVPWNISLELGDGIKLTLKRS